MIAFAVVAAAIVIVGTAVARRVWRRLDGDDELANVLPLELVAAGAVVGLGLWLAVNWLLALTQTLTRGLLLVFVVAFVGAAGVIAARWITRMRGVTAQTSAPRLTDAAGLVFIPLVVWLLFALWRGAVIPPITHDALSYHLPKAVILMKACGYAPGFAPDLRIQSMPWNYEILLADVLILSRSDALTEWISTTMVLLFLLVTAAMAERWWGRGKHVIAATLAAGATPLLLLQGSSHKNDVMTAALGAVAILWGARWASRGGRMAMFLLMLSLVLGVGTKPNNAAILVGLAPFLILRAVRETRSGTLKARDWAVTALAGALIFAFGGGASYVRTFLATGMPVGTATGGESVSAVQYGDWQNVWQVPYLMLTVPFSQNPLAVWLPWKHEYWFWPRYELFFSHLGPLFSILVVVLPFAVWRFRRDEPSTARERWVALLASAIAFMIALPVEVRPIGFFAAFPRYTLFLIPVVICWTLVPFLRRMEHRPRETMLLLVALTLFFSAQAIEYTVRDRFTPLAYVRWAAAHPGNRSIWFMPNRAASVVDRLAGPRDTVAVEGAFDTWVYPAYGVDRTRTVLFLPPQSGPKNIPAEADWVIVDRSWNAIWSHPKLTDMGKTAEYLGRGTPSADDVRLLELLRNDSRFKQVYHSPRTNQAVFQRISGSMAQ